jgi:hypothetical protein
VPVHMFAGGPGTSSTSGAWSVTTAPNGRPSFLADSSQGLNQAAGDAVVERLRI